MRRVYGLRLIAPSASMRTLGRSCTIGVGRLRTIFVKRIRTRGRTSNSCLLMKRGALVMLRHYLDFTPKARIFSSRLRLTPTNKLQERSCARKNCFRSLGQCRIGRCFSWGGGIRSIQELYNERSLVGRTLGALISGAPLICHVAMFSLHPIGHNTKPCGSSILSMSAKLRCSHTQDGE